MRVDLPTHASPITFTTFVEFSIMPGTIKSEVVGLIVRYCGAFPFKENLSKTFA